MTLSTHAIVGAAIASVMPAHPVIGFVVAFASHFLLDAIPHWDYALSSQIESVTGDPMDTDMMINKSFFFDLLKIGSDMFLGVAVVLFFFTFNGPHLFWIPFVGVAGAVLPDALQFIYMKWKHQPMTSLQKFHLWIHAQRDYNERPSIGIPLQIVFAALVIFVGYFKSI